MSYLYFVYREINTKKISLTDFIGKIGIGKGDRCKSYGTAYSNDYTTLLWHVENPRKYEKKILSFCREKDWIREHSSGRCSEVLNIEVTEDMTMKECISLYKDVCNQIVEKISSIIGFSGINPNTEEEPIPVKKPTPEPKQIEVIVIDARRNPSRSCKKKQIYISCSDNSDDEDYNPEDDE